MKEELLQEVLPHSQGAPQHLLTYVTPVLTDGVCDQKVPHSVSNGCQSLEALHVDQEGANALTDVLLTAENRKVAGEEPVTKLTT